jgi:hypothetical protein
VPASCSSEARHSQTELSDPAPDDGDTSAEDGVGKDIQAHLRHSRPDTTAHEYMQELPESVQQMVGSVYLMLTKGGEKNCVLKIYHKTPQAPPKKRL